MRAHKGSTCSHHTHHPDPLTGLFCPLPWPLQRRRVRQRHLRGGGAQRAGPAGGHLPAGLRPGDHGGLGCGGGGGGLRWVGLRWVGLRWGGLRWGGLWLWPGERVSSWAGKSRACRGGGPQFEWLPRLATNHHVLASPSRCLQTCPAGCGQGTCLPTSGTCECFSGYVGDACQACAPGFLQVGEGVSQSASALVWHRPGTPRL